MSSTPYTRVLGNDLREIFIQLYGDRSSFDRRRLLEKSSVLFFDQVLELVSDRRHPGLRCNLQHRCWCGSSRWQRKARRRIPARDNSVRSFERLYKSEVVGGIERGSKIANSSQGGACLAVLGERAGFSVESTAGSRAVCPAVGRRSLIHL